MNKPKSVHLKTRVKNLDIQTAINQKIERYTSLRLDNLLHGDYSRTLHSEVEMVESLKAEVLSDKIFQRSRAFSNQQKQTTPNIIQAYNDMKRILSPTSNFINVKEIENSSYFSERGQAQKPDLQVDNQTQKAQTIDFQNFQRHHRISSRNQNNVKLIGTSGISAGALVQCNNKQKIGNQICQVILGSAPTSRKSQATTIQNDDGILKSSNLDQFFFDPRRTNSKLFTRNVQILNKTVDSEYNNFQNKKNLHDQLTLSENQDQQEKIGQSDQESEKYLNKKYPFSQGSSRVNVNTPGASHRLHSREQIKNMRRTIRNQIAKSYEKQLNQLENQKFQHQSPFIQCAIQHQEAKLALNRQKICAQLLENLTKSEEKKLDQSTQEICQAAKPGTQVVNLKRAQQIQEFNKYFTMEIETVQNDAKFTDLEELRIHLREKHPERKKEKSIKSLYKSSVYLQKQLLQQQQQPGGFSDRFKQAFQKLIIEKKMSQISEKFKNDDYIQKALEQANKKEKITTSVAISSFCDDQNQQIRLMMSRRKYDVDAEEKEEKKLAQHVETHCATVFSPLESNNAFLDKMFNLRNYSPQSKATVASPTSSRRATFQMNAQMRATQNFILSRQSQLSPKQRAKDSIRKQTIAKTPVKRNKALAGFDLKQRADIFSNFVDQREARFSIDCYTNQLLEKLYFQKMAKRMGDRPGSQSEVYKDDLRLSYFEKCRQFQEPVIDLLNKIQQKNLLLVNYRLSLGQCQGLMSACEVDPDALQVIVIDNCGADDEMMACIFRGLAHQRKVIKVNIRNTQIGIEAVKQIKKVLEKPIPYNLEELKFENCVFHPLGISLLLQRGSQASHLVKLALINLNFDFEHLTLLKKFLHSARYLIDLDLSWNRFQLAHFIPVFQEICQNRRLQRVSIAWNSLVENNNLGNVGSVSLADNETTEIKTYRKRKVQTKLKTRKSIILEKALGTNEIKGMKQFNQLERLVVENLQNFIAQNSKLLHLDLSETGLSDEMIYEIVKALNYSNSIIGLHLSGNPGLSNQLYTKIYAKINATYEKPHKLTSYVQFLNRDASKKFKLAQDNQILEGQQLKQIQAQKQALFPKHVGGLNDIQKRHLILTRKLGHKTDIPGGHEWQVFTHSQDECYDCDRKIYTLFIWSPEVGVLSEEEMDLTQDQKEKILRYILLNRETNLRREQQVKLISEIAKDPKLIAQTQIIPHDNDITVDLDESESLTSDSSVGVSEHSVSEKEKQKSSSIKQTNTLLNFELPQLTKQMTQYLMKFGPVRSDSPEVSFKENLVRIRGKEVPLLYGQFNNWQPQPMIRVEVLSEYILNQDRPDFLQLLKNEEKCRVEVTNVSQLNEEERVLYDQEIFDYESKFDDYAVWSKAVRKLVQYKQPHICGIDQLQNVDPEEIFIGANFMSSGRQLYAVSYQNQMYFHRTIADFRREELIAGKIDAKELGKIDRNPNVFKNFVSDTVGLIDSCFKFDMEAWKFQKFVKDPFEQQEVKSIIKREYSYLKDLFINLSSRSNYPCLSSQDFRDFIDKIEIIDDTMTNGIVETQFIASRTDADNRGMKVYAQQLHPLDINRFEFFETLVRVAGIKYKQQRVVPTWHQALDLLIQQIKETFEFDFQQDFREKLLYTREVNLTLDANKKGLHDVYNLYINKKTQRMSMDRCMDLLTTDTRIKLTIQDAQMCYAMSQATCADLVRNGALSIGHITFIEFLELTARVADLYLQDMDEPLEVKINYVLDEWLPLAGYEREEPILFEEGIFEESEDESEAYSPLIRMKNSKVGKLTRITYD